MKSHFEDEEADAICAEVAEELVKPEPVADRVLVLHRDGRSLPVKVYGNLYRLPVREKRLAKRGR